MKITINLLPGAKPSAVSTAAWKRRCQAVASQITGILLGTEEVHEWAQLIDGTLEGPEPEPGTPDICIYRSEEGIGFQALTAGVMAVMELLIDPVALYTDEAGVSWVVGDQVATSLVRRLEENDMLIVEYDSSYSEEE